MLRAKPTANGQTKMVSEYDQEIPQSQTTDNPTAPRGRATRPITVYYIRVPFNKFRYNDYVNIFICTCAFTIITRAYFRQVMTNIWTSQIGILTTSILRSDASRHLVKPPTRTLLDFVVSGLPVQWLIYGGKRLKCVK